MKYTKHVRISLEVDGVESLFWLSAVENNDQLDSFVGELNSFIKNHNIWK